MQTKSKSVTKTYRIEDDINSAIQEEAIQTSTSLSSIVNKQLRRYVEFERYTEKFDETIVSTNFLQKIINSVPMEKAFHFYFEINKYSGLYADSLNDFADKIKTIDSKSILFHMSRKDFENWIRSLGDVELARKVGVIKTLNLSGEELRKELIQSIKTRCEELVKYIG